MSLDRWGEIEKLYHAALEREPQERAAFLEQCSDEVRKEVQSLLDHEHTGDRLLDNPALEPQSGPSLAPGTRLGPYEIMSGIGAGGMGEVYRARDTRLHRDVAIKTSSVGYTERFSREVRAVAALNHPNICTLHDVGPNYLVMELVEGETLGALLKPGPLKIEMALNYARQIAEALEAAHEKGIIHRDLKPGNIMVTPAGLVKVLDFGLAKTEEAPAGEATMQSSTHTGVILGTAAYMSPEQARAEAVDKRTDIWAFGVVLYEMLTGRRAFPGESVTDILAGVLRGEPDWSAVPAATPLGIRKLLRRCLERDRKQRLQAIGEARIEIEAALAEESDSSIVASLIRKHKKGAIGSVALVAALVGATWFLLHRPPQPSAELTQKRLTFNSSENPVGSEEISPDGMYLAYSDPAGIHVRLLSTGEERLIPSPAGVRAGADWVVASWFPDGTQLLADANEDSGRMTTWAVSVLGQSPRELREGAAGCDVSPDGTHIVFRPLGDSDHFREIWVMGIQGDTPHKVLAAGENESLICVRWSPDGHRLAYIRNPNSSDRLQSSIETCDLKGANRTVVVPADRDLLLVDFHWFPEGRIVYEWKKSSGSDSYLSQVAIDNQAGTPNGKPKRITQWAGSDVRGLSGSADGKRLVLQKRTHQFQVYLGELAAGGTRMKPPQRLTNNEASEWPTAWTADSKAIWIASNRSGTYGIYKQGISQQTSEPVITGLPDIPFFRLSADAAWILFVDPPRTAANPPAPERLMRVPASGGAPQLVLEIRNLVDFRCAPAPASLCVISEMSPDKKQLMITAFDPVKGRGRVLRTIDNDPPHPYGSALSPDGSTLAVSHPEEPRILIRLLSLSGGSDREITVKGWSHITSLDWSPDGKGLHCVSVSPQGSTLLYVDMRGNARVLWQYKGGSGPIWSVPSPDGRYLAILADVNNENVWMVEGF